MPLKPHLLDYENTQFLLIGHHEGGLEKAKGQDEGGVKEKDEGGAVGELERLEEEDEGRVEGLRGMCFLLLFVPWFFGFSRGGDEDDEWGDFAND